MSSQFRYIQRLKNATLVTATSTNTIIKQLSLQVTYAIQCLGGVLVLQLISTSWLTGLEVQSEAT